MAVGRRGISLIACAALFVSACGNASPVSEVSTSSAGPDFLVDVTATGQGGCVDAVEVQNLEQEPFGSGASVGFDLVYVHSCGEPSTISYDEPAVLRSSTGGPPFTIRTPDCDDTSCLVGTSIELGIGDNPLPLVVEADGPLVESETIIRVPGLYRYSTEGQARLNVRLTVRVSKAAAPPSGDTSPIATADRRVESVFAGFDEIEFPFAGVADNAAELESFGLTVPDGIDWSTRAAVVFSIPTDLCPPVLDDLEIVDRIAKPLFVNPGYEACAQPLLSHTVIAAVDRRFLAEADTLRLPKQPPFFRKAVDADITISPSTAAIDEPTTPAPTFELLRGTVDVPRRGEATSHRLDDGTPVMVVHHYDGTISALDARATSSISGDGFIQRLVLVRWLAKTRNVAGGGVWDEYGRSTGGPRSNDLKGFATRVTGDRLEIGDPIDPPTGAPITETSDPPAAADVRADTGPGPVSLEQALTMPIGSVIYIDAQLVFVGTDARLCAEDGTPIYEAETCPEGSPIAEGIDGDPDILNIWHAPVLATRSQNGFTDIVPTAGYSSTRISE